MSVLAQWATTPGLRHSISCRHVISSFATCRYASSPAHMVHHTQEPPQQSGEIAPGLVDLEFETWTPADQCGGGPLIVVHGLFGSKQNWRSLSKLLANTLKRQVYALDMRNHGTSPHRPEMTYELMAGDVVQFMVKHGCKEDVTLMGHSMGGKVVMATALSPLLKKHLPNALQRLISVDMTPAIGKLSDEFQAYIEAMQAVEDAKVPSKKEADPILAKWEPDLAVRQFLLTNLIPDKQHGSRFRIPLTHLRHAIDEIGTFPYPPDGSHTWPGPALFIKGEKSKYVNRRNIPLITTYFPNAKLEVLDTGHWVHSERPKEFVSLVTSWIDEHSKTKTEGL